MGWLVLFPVLLIAGAWIASIVAVRNSSLRISAAGVEIRNGRQAPRVVPLAEAETFVPSEAVGAFKFLRPATAVLVCTDGRRLPVRALAEPDAGYGIEALNRRLAAVRAPS